MLNRVTNLTDCSKMLGFPKFGKSVQTFRGLKKLPTKGGLTDEHRFGMRSLKTMKKKVKKHPIQAVTISRKPTSVRHEAAAPCAIHV